MYSLNEFHVSSMNLPGQEISPRKYKLMISESRERNPSPYTNIGLYKNEIYTYTSITYESTIDKCIFLLHLYTSHGGCGSYIITTYVM